MDKKNKMSKEKKLIVALCVILVLVPFVPRVALLKDGGSKEFTALTYRVTKVHSLNSVEAEEEFTTGTVVEVFGKEVYNSVN